MPVGCRWEGRSHCNALIPLSAIYSHSTYIPYTYTDYTQPSECYFPFHLLARLSWQQFVVFVVVVVVDAFSLINIPTDTMVMLEFHASSHRSRCCMAFLFVLFSLFLSIFFNIQRIEMPCSLTHHFALHTENRLTKCR